MIRGKEMVPHGYTFLHFGGLIKGRNVWDLGSMGLFGAVQAEPMPLLALAWVLGLTDV